MIPLMMSLFLWWKAAGLLFTVNLRPSVSPSHHGIVVHIFRFSRHSISRTGKLWKENLNNHHANHHDQEKERRWKVLIWLTLDFPLTHDVYHLSFFSCHFRDFMDMRATSMVSTPMITIILSRDTRKEMVGETLRDLFHTWMALDTWRLSTTRQARTDSIDPMILLWIIRNRSQSITIGDNMHLMDIMESITDSLLSSHPW